MLVSRLPRRYEKVIHYEVVKCIKCGSISVVKAHFHQPAYDPVICCCNDVYVELNKLGEYHEPICRRILRLFGIERFYDRHQKKIVWREVINHRVLKDIGFTRKHKREEETTRITYHCIDGICQNCIDKENLNIVFSEDNPIRNYRSAYDKYTSKLPYIFYSKEKSLPSRITKEFLLDLNADAYNSIICGSNPQTIEEKRALAEKYVESAKESIINHIMPHIQTDENYIRLKNALDKATKDALEFLQKSGNRIYRCSKLNYRKDANWIKTDSCPSMPDSIVSDCKFYYLAERYNAEKMLIKIKERMNTDLLAEFESYFEKLFDTLKSKIAKSHLWDVYE